MALSECPQCAAHLTLNPEWQTGMSITCPECGVRMEIVSLEPFEVELIEE